MESARFKTKESGICTNACNSIVFYIFILPIYNWLQSGSFFHKKAIGVTYRCFFFTLTTHGCLCFHT